MAGPRATVARHCVSPRVKRPEPCTEGSRSACHASIDENDKARPSALFFVPRAGQVTSPWRRGKLPDITEPWCEYQLFREEAWGMRDELGGSTKTLATAMSCAHHLRAQRASVSDLSPVGSTPVPHHRLSQSALHHRIRRRHPRRLWGVRKTSTDPAVSESRRKGARRDRSGKPRESGSRKTTYQSFQSFQKYHGKSRGHRTKGPHGSRDEL